MPSDLTTEQAPPASAPALQQAPAANPGTDQAPPHALGPEKSILSSMLNDPAEFIGRAVEAQLGRDHFYLPAHATLFEELHESYSKGKEIELVEFIQRLADKGLLDKVGGPQAVYEIYTYAPNAGHFDRHLELVKDKFILRSIIRSCNESISRAYESPEDVTHLLDSVESSVLAIRDNALSDAAPSLQATLDEVIGYVGDLLDGRGDMQGLSTGYSDLDRLSNGLKGGEMFVVAARPSMGKTSLAMNIVENVCLDQGIPSLVFSCEMSSRQLVQRLLFARAGFIPSRVRDGLKQGKRPSRAEIQRIKNASEEIAASKLFLDDTPGITIDEVRAKARRRKRDDNIGFIAIDYLQLMRSESKQAENAREREIGQISAGVKGIAKELDIPVLVLAQLNRGPEGRTGKSLGVPRMSDLRESGTIEQDADLVGLLYRPEYYADSDEEKEEVAGKAELVIAKNRNGETGSVPLTFIAELMRFEPRAHEHQG